MMHQEMQLRAPRRAGSPATQPDAIRSLRGIGGRHRLVIALARGNERVMHSDAGMDRPRTPVRPPIVYAGIRARNERLARRHGFQHQRVEHVVVTLTQAVEEKDGYTAAHLRRLGSYASVVGARLGMQGAQLAALRCGALLHDVGKLHVDTMLIRKAGPLTADERLLMQQHSVIGERIVQPLGLDLEVAPIVRHHHERWDGHGYPDGLQGEAIPLGARIVAVADAFDAMTTQRSYNRAMTPEHAAARLQSGAGIFWDPQVVAAFLECLEAGLLL